MNTARETSTSLVIAIDGPSGSGKSSTSRGVAERLGLAYLDTGAMYRAATWLVLRDDVHDADAIAALVVSTPMTFSTDPTAFAISVDDTDVTEAIREPRISAAVSRVAGVQAVRDHLIALQRSAIAGACRRIVVEGRDITTVVAPEAEVRVLLVADPAARVARRQAELGDAVDAAQVTDQVIRRDRDDSAVTSFTEAAPGVTVVDSTHLDLAEVIDVICGLAEEPASTTPGHQP
ncbi:(d)CMP kinase [Mariniluteicoccus endophyticus]